jgi:four helix bundle protein
MATGKSFEDLVVYQKALQFVMSIYGLISALPKDDEFNLANLTKQAAVSITTNIGEGSKKDSPAEKKRYLNNALDALSECQYYLNFIREQGYAETAYLMPEAAEVNTLLEEHIQNSEE